ncbi:MAG: cobalt transporter, partial [Parasporobacterium sp.]|nr:cobalt transporter [Parasporobacterium sp.]
MHTHGDHVHSHSHEDIKAFDSKEQATALVSYMLDHNKSHAEELHEITHKLEATGLG